MTPLAAFQPQRLSIVIEWENILLAEQVRARRMLATLAVQCRELLRSRSDRRLPIAGPMEVLVLFDPEEAREAQIAEVIRECLGPADDAIHWQTVGQTGLSYYTLKNAGVKLASGDIVVQLDSDVIPDEGWLANLVAPFADPAVKVVGGNTYIGPTSLYAKTVALTWVFPLRARHGRLEPTRHFHANNVAFRRSLALAYPYQEFPGRTRGACSALALQLIANGIQPYLNFAAQVDHPAPNGLVRYLARALTQGRDQMLGFHTDPAAPRDRGRGLLASIKRSWKNWAQSLTTLCRERGQVNLRWYEIPAAVAIMSAYYASQLSGRLMTLMFRETMRRSFQS